MIFLSSFLSLEFAPQYFQQRLKETHSDHRDEKDQAHMGDEHRKSALTFGSNLYLEWVYLCFDFCYTNLDICAILMSRLDCQHRQ